MPRSLEEIRALAKSSKPAAAAGTPAAMKMPTLQKGHTPANASGRCAVIQILAPHTHPHSKVGWRPLSVLFKCNLHLNRTQTQWSPHAYSAQADIVSAHTHAFTTPHKRTCFQKRTHSLSLALHISPSCTSVFLCVCVLVYVSWCMHVFAYTWAEQAVEIPPYRCPRLPCRCMCVCVYLCVYLHAHARVRAYMYECAQVCTSVCANRVTPCMCVSL